MKKGASERRRKDHIAALILKLGDRLPKTTENRQLQKIGILGRAIDYIGELETKNREAAEKDGMMCAGSALFPDRCEGISGHADKM